MRIEDEEFVFPRGTDKAKVIYVIKTESLIGSGKEKDPVRTIYQYWNLQGQLLAKYDSYLDDINDSASSDTKS